MNSIFQKVKWFYRYILSFFPSCLPIGDAQFKAWFDDLTFVYDLPDNDSVRFAVGTMIMHMEDAWRDPKGKWHFYYKMPKRYFGLKLLKGGAQQQAYNVMNDIKARAAAAQKAAEEAAKAAAQAQPIQPVAATTTTVANGAGST